MGWSEALAGLANGAANMSNLFGTFQRREDEIANANAQRAFQMALHNDQMAMENKRFTLAETQAQRGHDLDVESLSVRKEELKEGRQYRQSRDQVEDAYNQEMLSLNKKNTEISVQNANARYINEVRERHINELQSVMKNPMYQTEYEEYKANPTVIGPTLGRAMEIEANMRADELRAKYERDMLTEEQKAHVDTFLERAVEDGADEQKAFILASRDIVGDRVIQQPEPKAETAGNGSAGNAPRQSRQTHDDLMGQNATKTASGEWRGKHTGATYNDKGDMVSIESPDVSINATLQAWESGKTSQITDEDVAQILSKYSDDEIIKMSAKGSSFLRFLRERKSGGKDLSGIAMSGL